MFFRGTADCPQPLPHAAIALKGTEGTDGTQGIERNETTEGIEICGGIELIEYTDGG